MDAEPPAMTVLGASVPVPAARTTYEAALKEWVERQELAHPPTPHTPSKRVNYTMRAQQRIAAGVHPVLYPVPLREPLGEHTCGDCAHLTSHEVGKRYFKCDLHDTASAASDIRRWWPACAKWAQQSDAGQP